MQRTAYSQLWGIVDGAVADAFKCHPDYLTPKGRRSAKTSVVKRVTGTVLSFAEESAKGLREQADKDGALHGPDPASLAPADDASAGAVFRQPQISEGPHCRIGRWTPKKWSRHRVNSRFAETTAQLSRFVADTNAQREESRRADR